MPEDNYIELYRKGRDLVSKSRYVNKFKDELVEIAVGSDVRFLWPNGDETKEKIISKPVAYQTVRGGGLRTITSELPTIRVRYQGLEVALYDLEGLKVHRDDVEITPGK